MTPEPRTEAEELVLGYVRAMSELVRGSAKEWAYPNYASLLLDRGRFGDLGDRPRPKGFRRGEARMCYRNSLHAARRRGWAYVEGYATSTVVRGMAIEHAWCEDSDGRVVETTWPELGTAYLGAEFPTREVEARSGRTGEYGVLGTDYREDFRLLKEGHL